MHACFPGLKQVSKLIYECEGERIEDKGRLNPSICICKEKNTSTFTSISDRMKYNRKCDAQFHKNHQEIFTLYSAGIPWIGFLIFLSWKFFKWRTVPLFLYKICSVTKLQLQCNTVVCTGAGWFLRRPSKFSIFASKQQLLEIYIFEFYVNRCWIEFQWHVYYIKTNKQYVSCVWLSVFPWIICDRNNVFLS